jgi:hypothetical protein
MTRIEAIATITAQLATLDDENLKAIAGLVQEMVRVESTATDSELRPLTDKERALIAHSKEDFRLGRVYSAEEYEHEMDAFMQELRTKHSKSA